MRRFLALTFCLAFAPSARADEAAEKPTLVLDAGGHTAVVRKVLFTPDGRELISVSDDKTVRVWDVASGDALRVFRPPIGKGYNGMLFAVAISPDGRTLAVSGFGFNGGPFPIYLIALSTGRIERTLTGHLSSIHSVAFSPDGKRIATASDDMTSRVWNVATGQTERVLEGHTAPVYGITFSPDGRHLATASYDSTGRIWSADTGQVEAVLKGGVKELYCVAWSPDGRTIATGSLDQSVRLYDTGGQSTGIFEALGNQVGALCFTPDSREILTALGGEGTGKFCSSLLNIASGKVRLSFDKHNNTVLACHVRPDGTLAASAGANDNEIFIWKTSDGTMVHRLAGKGRKILSVGWSPDGGTIAWGNSYHYESYNQWGPIERTFNLADLEIASATGVSFVRAKPERGSVSLKRVDQLRVDVERTGAPTVSLKMDFKYEQIQGYSLLPDDRVVISAAYGLYLYDALTGKQLRFFQGHTGVVWAVAPSPDGRLMLTSSDDQTVRVWDPNREEPLLSLFVAGDDWVAWTPEGYYAASPGGERLMGWHVGNGPEQLATFYPAAKFRKAFYRPDVIKLVLSTGGTDRAMEFADRAKGRVSEKKVEVEEILPPVVSITAPTRSGKTVDASRLVVKAVARSRGEHPVTALRLLLDGRPYLGQAGVKTIETPKVGEVNVNWTVELEPGVHKLTVQAESEKSQGLSDPVEVTYAPEQEVVLPTLYVLAIGVSAYPGDLRLHYAAADAKALEDAFTSKSGTLYKKVVVKRLTDDGAKRRDVLAGLTWLRKQMTQRDVGVVFFSGHGMRDGEGSLYLLPVDADPDDLLATAVADDQLKKALGGMPGRVIAMLDACHAGAAGGDKRKAPYTITDDLVRDLVTDDYGVIVMASSTGREFSLENNAKRQSNFTLAIVEGLSGAADYNKDKVVYFNELDNYVSDRVKELSRGQQHPVSARPTSVRSFPLSRP